MRGKAPIHRKPFDWAGQGKMVRRAELCIGFACRFFWQVGGCALLSVQICLTRRGKGGCIFHRHNVFLTCRHLSIGRGGQMREHHCPLVAQTNFSQQKQNSTVGNTRWRYPQPQELLTHVIGATRLRVVGTARPVTVEARTANPVEQPLIPLVAVFKS